MKSQTSWRRAIAALLPNSRQLDQMTQALAKTADLRDAKGIRDWAEAARKFAQSAGLGLKIQSQAAVLKLRAERRAGEMLAGLALHGGDRKSSSHTQRLTLANLGIDPSESSRWQLEASVPEAVFTRYVAAATAAQEDITTQGLLRLQKSLAGRAGKASRLSNAALLILSNGKDSRRKGPRRSKITPAN